MTESIEDRIRRHEGFCGTAKPDAKGAWVIGFGHDIPESEASNYPDGCTAEEADNWLEADIDKATTEVANALPWVIQMDELRQGVLVEMAFQLGLNGLLGFRLMLQACSAGDYALAAKNMLASEWHQQTPERCEELSNIMLTGESN